MLISHFIIFIQHLNQKRKKKTKLENEEKHWDFGHNVKKKTSNNGVLLIIAFDF